MILPEMPTELRALVPQSAWSWWQAFKSWMNSQMSTQGDVTLETKGKGVVFTNAAGTIAKRVRLNDAGDGIIIEDV